MNIKKYNPSVQVEFLAGDNRLFLAATLKQVPDTFAVLGFVRDVMADALRTSGVYHYPLHVRVGDRIGTLSVNLV